MTKSGSSLKSTGSQNGSQYQSQSQVTQIQDTEFLCVILSNEAKSAF